MESRRWFDGAQRMMAAGDDAGFPEPICHVHHIDLISDPVSTVDTVYRHFGLRLSASSAAGIEQYVSAQPKGAMASTATTLTITV